jgi:beta-1,4-mannosyltransferase
MILRFQFRPDFILLQNPPAIPTLPVCWLFSLALWADFVVDWHNYGYSLMAIAIGEKNPIVQVSRGLENYFGKKADKHMCVTRAMKDDLKMRLGVE